MVEVVAALIWNKDKFLICQRPANKARALLWEFVGGKVEKGETKEQALIRECKEELNVTILEVCNMNLGNDYILSRESYWKNILMTREFGLNKN